MKKLGIILAVIVLSSGVVVFGAGTEKQVKIDNHTKLKKTELFLQKQINKRLNGTLKCKEHKRYEAGISYEVNNAGEIEIHSVVSLNPEILPYIVDIIDGQKVNVGPGLTGQRLNAIVDFCYKEK